jgi:hypothetical protein
MSIGDPLADRHPAQGPTAPRHVTAALDHLAGTPGPALPASTHGVAPADKMHTKPLTRTSTVGGVLERSRSTLAGNAARSGLDCAGREAVHSEVRATSGS